MTLICQRCATTVSDLLKCDCNQCACDSLLCKKCLEQYRCQKCAQICRSWLHNQTELAQFNESGDWLKILVIQSTWTNNNFYVLNLGSKKDLVALQRATSELEFNIGIMRNCFPIGYCSDLLQNMQCEYASILEQIKVYKISTKKKTACKFCFDDTLDFDEKQRHADYHVQKNLLDLKKENRDQEITRNCDKNCKHILENLIKQTNNQPTNVLQIAINKAITYVDAIINKHDRHVNRLFDDIKKNSMLQKNDPVLISNRLLWDDCDNKRCPTCGDVLQVSIDRSQDDDFAYCDLFTIRLKTVVYCNVRCAKLVDAFSMETEEFTKSLSIHTTNNIRSQIPNLLDKSTITEKCEKKTLFALHQMDQSV